MEKYAVPNKLPSVEISILAQRKARLHFAKSAKIQRALKAATSSKFRNPESFIAEHWRAHRDHKRIKRNIRKTGLTLKNRDIKEGKLVLVYRHHGYQIANDSVREMLTRLGLGTIHHATLLRLTKNLHFMMKVVEPYVIWGYPTLSTVTDLINKHGMFLPPKGSKVTGRVAISSNKHVEDLFGQFGIICVQDLQNEIFNLGKYFEKVMQSVQSFELTEPVGLWPDGKKSKPRSIGGEAGFRGNEINDLFKRLL